MNIDFNVLKYVKKGILIY